MWSDQGASAKRSYKAQFQRKESEGKRKDGKTTSEIGQVSISTAVEDHQRWQKIVADVNSGAPTTLMVPGHMCQVSLKWLANKANTETTFISQSHK